MKAHEVRALINDPVAKARMHIEDEIKKRIMLYQQPTEVYVLLSLSPQETDALTRELFEDGFSVRRTRAAVAGVAYCGLTVIWHEKARTVRGPLASNTITDTGPVQPNGDRQ